MTVSYLQEVYGATALCPAVTTQKNSAASLLLQVGQAYDVTLTQNTAFLLPTLAAGVMGQIWLQLRQGNAGGYTPALPPNVKWPGGAAPTPNAILGNIDLYVFRTMDGGATWLGAS